MIILNDLAELWFVKMSVSVYMKLVLLSFQVFNQLKLIDFAAFQDSTPYT